MVEIYLTTDLTVTGYGTVDALESELGRVMEQLVSLSGPGCDVDDPAISLDLGTQTVTVELLVRGEDFDAATRNADIALRTSVHAAGGATPAWEVTKQSQRAELVDL